MLMEMKDVTPFLWNLGSGLKCINLYIVNFRRRKFEQLEQMETESRKAAQVSSNRSNCRS